MPNQPIIISARTLIEPLALLVDGFPGERQKLNTQTGGEPLEDGRQVTDHAVATPQVLALTGIVSNAGGVQRPIAAWEAIVNLWKQSEPVRVTTEWGTFPEMVIGRCERVTDRTRALRFEMELREILRVSTLFSSTALSGIASRRTAELARGRVPLTMSAGQTVETEGGVGRFTRLIFER